MNDELTNALAEYEPGSERQKSLMIEEARQRMWLVGELMQNGYLKEKVHYSEPGAFGKNSKPSLLQAGAQVIANAFQLDMHTEVLNEVVNNGPFGEYDPKTPFISYTCRCTARHRFSGATATGVGSCNSWEDKYLWRSLYRSETPTPGLLTRERGGRGGGTYTQIEQGFSIYTQQNTLLKMAKKRAYVDAVLQAVNCSDIFTQDIEDFPGNSGVVQQGARVDTSTRNEPPQYVDVGNVDEVPFDDPPPRRNGAKSGAVGSRAKRAPKSEFQIAFERCNNLFPGMDWKALSGDAVPDAATPDGKLPALQHLMRLFPAGKQIRTPDDQDKVTVMLKDALLTERQTEAQNVAADDFEAVDAETGDVLI